MIAMKLTPKGMRDFSPEEMIVRKQVIEKIERIYRLYGFRPLETPAMEYMKTLKAKAGEEIEGQIFTIDGKKYGLRFDLTVPLARYAASGDFPRPFKRYAIERVWRKEEPQRGRFREFWQADVDIIGSPSMRCEAELLSLSKEICGMFGFEKPIIKVNNRKILNALSEKLKFEKNKNDVFRTLDKIDKQGIEKVGKMLEELLGVKKRDELFEYIKPEGSNRKRLDKIKEISPEGAKELEEILSFVDFPLEVDLSLVRGLGYYTGPIFEIKLSKSIGTVIAGGRYDNLMGVYGRDDSATGISVGIERLITLLMEKNKKNIKKTETLVYVACVKPEFYKNAVGISEELRKNGISSEVDLNERNLRKQFEYVNSLGIPFTVIVGKKEIESRKYTLRNMESGEETKIPMDKIIKRMKSE